MDLANYKMEWPRERLTVRCFAHDIMNYRYHWHPDEYELNILLHGSQEYCRGTQNVVLEEDDVLLTPPGVGHASFGQQANTTAIVLHFSATAIRPLLKKGGVYHFPSCLSNAGTHRRTLPSYSILCQPDFHADAAEQSICTAGCQGKPRLAARYTMHRV